MEEEFYVDDEYEKRRAARKARIIAEQKRQARNRIFFFGGIALVVIIIIVVIVTNIINKAVKEGTSSDLGYSRELMAEEIAGDFDPEEALLSGITQKEENQSSTPATNDKPEDFESFTVNNKNKKFTLNAADYNYSAASDIVTMSSSEFTSDYGIMINVNSKSVIATKDGYTKMYPASMTKVMTVLTAWQYLSEEDLDKKVAIPSEAIAYDLKYGCSSAGFEEGEVVTIRDLFYGTILPSGADAAYTLALTVAGSHEEFVNLMNENVRDLGLSETTHFTNCVGIYDDNLYTTCYDMAVILAATLSDDFLSEVMNARKYVTSETGFHEEGIEISNWFLRRIEDKNTGGNVVGAKTGFVNESGCCGASCMKGDNGNTYICVSGKTWSSWRCIYDHVAAYNIYTGYNTGYHKG